MNQLKKTLILLSVVLLCSNSLAQLKVIFKLDDLAVLNNKNSFKNTTNYLISKKVKASLGIIGNRLDKNSLNTLEDVLEAKDSSENYLFEIWHHGYDHVIPEFKDRDFDYQNSHFKNGNESVLKLIGLQMNTFGAPGNANDSVTNSILNNYEDYHIYFYNSFKGNSKSNKFISLNQRVEMEDGIGNVNFDFFLNNFNKYSKYWKDNIILQGHPNAWDTTKLEEFKKVVQYLIDQKVEIVLPNEYFLSLRQLNPPVINKVSLHDNQNIIIDWKSNDDINNYYLVQKSVDGIKWKTIGKQYSQKQQTNKYFDQNISAKNYYRIKINSSLSNVEYSNQLLLSTNLDLSKSIKKYEIQSNPFTDYLKIKLLNNDYDNLSVELYNTNGDLLIKYEGNKNLKNNILTLETVSLNSGIYFCVIKVDNKKYFNKIIKK